MNIATYQEKKNEEMNTGKRRERRQVINFKEAVCCPSAVVQGAAQQKIICMRGCLGPLGKPTTILTQPQWGQGPYHHFETTVDWFRPHIVATFSSLVP